MTGPSPRERVRQLVESKPFQSVIIALILLNAVVLGIETYPAVMRQFGDVLHLVNAITVGIFVVEIALRIVAHGKKFFTDPWSLFDLFVVAIALVPATGGSAVIRVLRVLRVLRLLSAVRSMRLVVGALGAAIPGIASIGGLLAIIVYVFTVMSTTLYSTVSPAYFGDLARSAASLFRIMIGDGWPDIITPMAQNDPWVWLYFILFTVCATFIVLNLFIAVTVEAMDRQKAGEPGGESDQLAEVLSELAALRIQLDRIEKRADPPRA